MHGKEPVARGILLPSGLSVDEGSSNGSYCTAAKGIKSPPIEICEDAQYRPMKQLRILAFFTLALCLPLAAHAQSDEPDIDSWVEVTEEPKPTVDIQRLVVYPADAQRTNIEGTVTVSALIGEDGKVIRVVVEKSDHEWLTEAAVDAMKKVRFTPAKQGDKAIKVWYTQSIKFRLNTDEPALETRIAQPTEILSRIEDRPVAKLIGQQPVLPKTASLNGISSIEVEFQIGTYGHVLNVKAADASLQEKLTEPVLKVLRDLRFEPGTVDGKPKLSRATLTFSIKK